MSSSHDYAIRDVETRFAQGGNSSGTLRFSISYKDISEPYDEETFNLVPDILDILDKEKLELISCLNLCEGCAKYNFEYSSPEYNQAYSAHLEFDAEFGIELEITSGRATKMVIRTTHNDVTVPLHSVPLYSEQAIDPDEAAITAFAITALNGGGKPGTVGTQATRLQALARFGRKHQTPERPFSLTMLADPEQWEAASKWVEMFRSAPDTTTTNERNITSVVEAFRAGHSKVWEEEHPLDLDAIRTFMTSALNRGVNPSTANGHASLLLSLARFGRKKQTLDRPFSLTMLVDEQQQEAARDWLEMFRTDPNTTPVYRARLLSAVKAFGSGYTQAQESESLDVAIKTFATAAMERGAHPVTVATKASLLHALSRFGQKNQTAECPFSLIMLVDPQQKKEGESWLRKFSEAPGTTKNHRLHLRSAIETFRTGHFPAREEGDPDDVAAVRTFMINALNRGANPSTAGGQSTLLQALARFGRKKQTPDRPFSLTMLVDPQQKEAADDWVRMFHDAPDTPKAHVTGAIKAFRAVMGTPA